MGLASKIKSHWKLDEDESGGVGEDANSTYDLTDRNTVTSATGKVGKCVFCTASSQEAVFHADDDYFDLADGAGFSLWLKTESSFDGSSTRRALTKRNQFEVYKTNAASEPDLKVKINKSPSGSVTTTVKSSLTTDEWVFLYFAVDGSNFRYSVNGESLQTGGAMTAYKTAGYGFEVGAWSGTGDTSRYWNSEVDEVSYWGELLTDAELTTLFAGGDGLAFPWESSLLTRNTITIYSSVALSSCSGSGPTYTANYGSSVANVQVGDWITANKRVAGGDPGGIVSVYTYQVTGITDADTLTVKYITDTNGDGDDSPCDLPSGTGSSGSPNKAPHKFTRDLGAAFEMFIDY